MDVSSALASSRRRRLLVPPAILALAVSMGPGSADPSPAERSHQVNAVVGDAANLAVAVTIPDSASVAEGGAVANGLNHPPRSDVSGPGSSGADTRPWFVAASGDNNAAGTRSAALGRRDAEVDRASKGDAIV